MNRLYWRIFIAFWLVIVMTIIVTVAVGSLARRSDVADTRFAALSGLLDALAEQAQGRLQAAGRPGLIHWLRDRQAAAPQHPLLIVDADGREILGRPVPPPVMRIVRGDDDGGHRRGIRSISRTLTGSDGARYLLFLPRPGPPMGRWFASPTSRRVFPVVLVLISGIACLLLARHLTGPIREFRSVGRRIAGGELGARIGPGLGQRKDEFGALARDFDHMAARIEQLVGGQQRLLRDVSHELRSPLARLNAAVALIRQRDDGAVLQTNLERIERESEKLDALIGQVLGYARLQAQQTIERQVVDLADIVHDVGDDARFEAAARDRVVECEAATLMAAVDPALMHSAIENVVRNAVQHSERVTSIDLRGDDAGTSVRLVVADDGAGLADATDAERLFEPFFTAGADGGAGIGLAIARRAVELHGGTIRAANRAGGGLAVTITLPRGTA